jgi:hypothetical protein
MMHVRARFLLARRLTVAVSATLALAGAPASAGTRAVIRTDLFGDGHPARVVLDRGRDPCVSVWRDGRRVWQGVPARWRPWKLLAGDVDGDGRPEIAIGVRKSTPYYRTRHNCLFIYGVVRGRIRARWLGSRLSRPYVDFALVRNLAGRAARLAAIETAYAGRRRLAIYIWSGFGFRLERSVGEWRTLRFVGSGPGYVEVRVDGRRRRIALGRPPRGDTHARRGMR